MPEPRQPMDVSGPITMYIAGDTVTAKFEFAAEMNLEEVIATFEHENGEHKIELIGEAVNSAYSPQIMDTPVIQRRLQYGNVRLEAILTGDDPPGEYTCKKITSGTAGTAMVAFEEKFDDLKFVVKLEPTRPPHVLGEIAVGYRKVTFPGRVYDTERDEYLEPSDRPL